MEVVKDDIEYIEITIKEVKKNSKVILSKDSDSIWVIRLWRKYLKRFENIKNLYKKASYNFTEEILPLCKSMVIPQNTDLYYELKNNLPNLKLEKGIENIFNKILGGLINLSLKNSAQLQIIYNHIKSGFKAIL